MKRPMHPDYDTAFQKLGDGLRQALEAHGSGTIGKVAEQLYDAVIALDDCYAFDEQDSAFTRVRPILQSLKR